eukprot:TRINITY_DN44728_c0_g1_i1.p3 TRINITY_DN44728_c0_g1~~TRINITY_DN44728_c0_g1_i1.p3  ORF type:complete len:111 (+),score=46.20 TRINITY_DN44728_c0_g1_i1:63-395(+)
MAAAGPSKELEKHCDELQAVTGLALLSHEMEYTIQWYLEGPGLDQLALGLTTLDESEVYDWIKHARRREIAELNDKKKKVDKGDKNLIRAEALVKEKLGFIENNIILGQE